jgi:hypothetical protein
MRKMVVLLILLGLPLPALAQAPGWFVIVGTNLKPGQDRCGAGIISGDLLGNAYYLGVRFTVVPERKFGPYPSVEEAQATLKDAGWTKLTDDRYQGSAGCG